MSFTDVFGGPNISPALLSYLDLEMDENTTLKWASDTGSADDVAASKIDVTASVGSLTITMPAADQVSVGQDVAFNNVGAYTVTILDNDGVTIGSVASGTMWLFYIRDNSTPAGLWRTLQLGTGVSSATAAALAGFGLYAAANTLSQVAPYSGKNAAYALTTADRAASIVSTGGVVTFSFQAAATLGNGWFVFVRNSGSGTLTLDPNGAETIDGVATKALAPGESCIVVSTGAALLSFGYGRSITNTVSAISIDIAGTGTISLTAIDLASIIQTYVGLLTGDRTVYMGSAAGFYLVYNHTTGAHTVTYAVDAGDPGVAVAQGSYSILRNDGTNVTVAFTATSGTVTNIATGTDLTGGPITTTGTIDHANSAVTPGTYGSTTSIPIFTVNARGHVTAAAGSGTVPGLAFTGVIWDYAFSTPPAGWIKCFGTIGNAASLATNRANADTEALFTGYWNEYSNTLAPVLPGGRGASAAADYAANKTIAITDLRGRVRAGPDNWGGSAAGLLTATRMSPDGNTPGATGGAQSETTTVTSSGSTSGALSVFSTGNALDGPSNTVSVAAGSDYNVGSNIHTHANVQVSGSTSGILSATVAGTTASATNVQPTIIVPVIIKL